MSQICEVHYDDGRSPQQFGVPDDYKLPPLLDHMDWLVLPQRPGENASEIAIKLCDVAWISVFRERESGFPTERES